MSKTTKCYYKKILDMSHSEARRFLLKGESYCNFSLPPYFKFDQFLNEISKKLGGANLKDFYNKNKNLKPDSFADVNHIIFHNKDGKYSWRPFTLINPVYYVALVQKITEEKNWEIIVDRFNQFSQIKKIECMSLPIESKTKQSDKANQINQWWQNVEQKSIQLALEYEYVFKTDITDCYGSIYTHSIAWALHGKGTAKKNRGNNLLGNLIDKYLRDTSHGQTNGIPQGSILSDFIAEIILGFADEQLDSKINNEELEDYRIIRYRDDYRIFVRNSRDGDYIVKQLCEVLAGLGLKLNPNKTTSSKNIIDESIKEDKRFWLDQKQYPDYRQQIMIIHKLANKYPNSGSLDTALTEYLELIESKSKLRNITTLISVIVDIAYNNPRTYAVSAAILSKLISCIPEKENKLEILEKIRPKFKKIPNTEHLSLWFQRITLTIERNYEYNESLCKLVLGEDDTIWNFAWLNDSFKNELNIKSIIDYKLIESLPEVIGKNEVNVFEY